MSDQNFAAEQLDPSTQGLTLQRASQTVARRATMTLSITQVLVKESSAAYWYEKGQKYAEQAQWLPAVHCWQQCVVREPTHWRALLHLAGSFAEIDKPAPAAQALQQAFGCRPPYWGEFTGQLPPDAWLRLQQALEKQSNNSQEEGYSLLFGIALIFYVLKKHWQARRTLDVMQSSYEAQVQRTAQWHCLSGYVWHSSHQLENAITAYSRAIMLDPKYVFAYYKRGEAKNTAGTYAEAITDYDQVIALDPDYLNAYYYRGIVKGNLDDYAGAIIDYSHAIALDPEDSCAYSIRGETKAVLGDYAGAISDFDQVIMLDPEDSWAYSGRGEAKEALGNYAGAILDFDQAIALDPDFFYHYMIRGNAKEKAGDYQGAVADQQKRSELSALLKDRV